MKNNSAKIIVVVVSLIFVSIAAFFIFLYSFIYLNLPRLPQKNYEDREVGDFVVRFYVDEDYCEIKGTSEQGNNKRFLVIPEHIDGVRVESLGVHNIFAWDASQRMPPEIESDMLEKVYFENPVKLNPHIFEYRCPNLKKIIYPGLDKYPYYINQNSLVYYPRRIHEEIMKQNSEDSIIRRSASPANVSYYYNYGNVENDSYYWIDDCDYGGKIEFVPKDPKREEYEFAGWYKEPECINKWDFDTDTLPVEKTEWKESYRDGKFELMEVTVYQETILYAKWI